MEDDPYKIFSHMSIGEKRVASLVACISAHRKNVEPSLTIYHLGEGYALNMPQMYWMY